MLTLYDNIVNKSIELKIGKLHCIQPRLRLEIIKLKMWSHLIVHIFFHSKWFPVFVFIISKSVHPNRRKKNTRNRDRKAVFYLRSLLRFLHGKISNTLNSYNGICQSTKQFLAFKILKQKNKILNIHSQMF